MIKKLLERLKKEGVNEGTGYFIIPLDLYTELVRTLEESQFEVDNDGNEIIYTNHNEKDSGN